MLPIQGVYEVAIRVQDPPRSELFYTKVLGLEVRLRDEKRRWVFLRAGGQAGTIVLQEDKSSWLAIEGPVYHEWMPAKSVYFSDPDGHDLELCTPLIS